MTVEFTNPRLSTLPAERMRAGILLADDFVSSARVLSNKGVVAGATVERGAVFGGAETITYDSIDFSGSDQSFVFKFKGTESGTLASNLFGPNGFTISVGDSGVSIITLDSGVFKAVSVAGAYLDGEIHTLTISILAGSISAYIDEVEAVTGAASIGSSAADVVVGNSFTGTIYYIRIFDDALSESEHLSYYNGYISSFMGNAIATYRCDSVGDDTNGNKIWDKQPTLKDLYKADRSDSDAFPTFDTDKYSFDYVDDYISNVPELPTDYTVSAVVQNPYALTAEIRQENDETLLTELKTAGAFLGYLRNMILHTGVLNALQLAYTEYQQLYYVARGYASGLYSRLFNESTAKAILVLSKSFFNWAIPGGATGSDIAISDDGATFPNSASHILLADKEELRISDGSIALFGDFDGSSLSGLVDKLANYKLSFTATHIDFNGSKFAFVPSNNKQLAVTWKSGYKPMFYADGEYIGSGDTIETIISTGTADVIIGNDAGLNTNSPHTINHVYIGDEPLTYEEVKALYQQSLSMLSETHVVQTIIQSTVDGDIILQSTVDGDPILQSTVI